MDPTSFVDLLQCYLIDKLILKVCHILKEDDLSESAQKKIKKIQLRDSGSIKRVHL